jgi:Zn-dependent protease with chaperone function
MLPDISTHYPPNPQNVPPDLTRPTARYRRRALLVVASLFLFVLVYLALIVGFGVVSFFALYGLRNIEVLQEHGPAIGTMLIAGSVFLGLCSGFAALYFVKGLFKFPKGQEHQAIEITEAEQPRLFAFIRQICADTGAPAPRTIVLTPEVNASVFYKCTFWSLFFPIKKNLHIGLGLVNALSLSEFKAVLAHEFGHFSQRSMRLGGYVYTANRIIHEVVYGRDWLDESLSAFSPVLNLVRKLLGGVFGLINFANSSLSRQMEFQADLVAVSISGSDAIIHGLVRTDFAQQCLDQTWQDLTAAGDHGLFTKDIFVHQSKAAEYLRILKDDPRLGKPPLAAEADAKVQVFPPNETVLPPMWASHPPHYERENNCKRIYIAGPADDRPACVLFENAEALREQITRRHYELLRPGQQLKLQDADVVQRFIDDDRAETVYSARYHGMYEEGVISPGELAKLAKSIPMRYEQPAKLLREQEAIFSAELREHMAAYRERRQDRDRLTRFANKVELPKGGVFQFRGKQHRTKDAEKLLETLETEIKADHDHLAALDRRIFLLYMGMATQLDPRLAQELEHRYHFHLAVQEMIQTLTYWNHHIQESFNQVTAQREPSPESLHYVGLALREAQDALGKHIAAANTLRMPAFKNMQAGQALSVFLDAKPVIHDLFGSAQFMDGSWLDEILKRHGEIIDKLRRVLFKSLGSLICFQEQVGEKYKAHYATGAGPSNLRELAARAAPPSATKDRGLSEAALLQARLRLRL